jgi:hypothetical protein
MESSRRAATLWKRQKQKTAEFENKEIGSVFCVSDVIQIAVTFDLFSAILSQT